MIVWKKLCGSAVVKKIMAWICHMVWDIIIMVVLMHYTGNWGDCEFDLYKKSG